MDGATSTRKYPAYTTAQLEAAVAAGKDTPAMRQEIADRKAGASVPLVVPQIVPAKDTSHLVALHDSLSRNRAFLADAKNDQQRAHFQRCIESKQREINSELRFLGMPTAEEFDAISDDELLAELGGI